MNGQDKIVFLRLLPLSSRSSKLAIVALYYHSLSLPTKLLAFRRATTHQTATQHSHTTTKSSQLARCASPSPLCYWQPHSLPPSPHPSHQTSTTSNADGQKASQRYVRSAASRAATSSHGSRLRYGGYATRSSAASSSTPRALACHPHVC